jgi:hypothetical protein
VSVIVAMLGRNDPPNDIRAASAAVTERAARLSPAAAQGLDHGRVKSGVSPMAPHCSAMYDV